MSFQAYLDNIRAKTGKGPEDFKVLAREKGLIGAKAGAVATWLKADFGLGQGHAMAIWMTLKTEGEVVRAPVETRLRPAVRFGDMQAQPPELSELAPELR